MIRVAIWAWAVAVAWLVAASGAAASPDGSVAITTGTLSGALDMQLAAFAPLPPQTTVYGGLVILNKSGCAPSDVPPASNYLQAASNMSLLDVSQSTQLLLQSATPLETAALMVIRGDNCTFVDRAVIAASKGYGLLVVSNNVAGANDQLIVMGASPQQETLVPDNITALFVTNSTGVQLVKWSVSTNASNPTALSIVGLLVTTDGGATGGTNANTNDQGSSSSGLSTSQILLIAFYSVGGLCAAVSVSIFVGRMIRNRQFRVHSGGRNVWESRAPDSRPPAIVVYGQNAPPMASAASPANAPETPAEILASVPESVYTATEAASGADDCCAICLDELQTGQAVRRLRCKHAFHSSCLDPWILGDRHQFCPMCKQTLRRARALSHASSPLGVSGEGSAGVTPALSAPALPGSPVIPSAPEADEGDLAGPLETPEVCVDSASRA